MILDSKLARILSNFCLDIAKAFFVVAFITPPLSADSIWQTILMLTRGVIGAIVFILLSWQFAKLEEKRKNELD